MRRLVPILALLWALPAVAREGTPVRWEGRVSLGPVWDSNPARAFTGSEAQEQVGLKKTTTIPGEAAPADDGLRFCGSLDANFGEDGPARGRLGYGLGVEHFGKGGADQRAHDLGLAGALELAPWLAPGVEARLRLRRLGDASRDTTDLSGAATLELAPLDPLRATLRLGARRFAYLPDDRHDFHGPFAGVALRFAPSPRHVFSAGWEVAVRDHRSVALGAPEPIYPEPWGGKDETSEAPAGTLGFREPTDPPPEGPEPDPEPIGWRQAELGLRRDVVHTFQAGWTWRGPVLLGAGWVHARGRSNAHGFDVDRHRFHVSAGGRLPGGLILTGQAALARSRYPEGFFLSEELLLDEGESLSAVTAKLSRSLGGGVGVEARWSLQASTSSVEDADLTYRRQVAGVSLTYRF